jgi:hypothetical protein
MTLRTTLVLPALVAVVAVLALPGCGSSSNDPVPPPGPTLDHTQIVLRDPLGNPLTATSTEPYSPRQTCGACHDVDHAANGYHFQQGRTDASGAVVTADNYFADGRTWLKSAGMYGKW